MHVSHPLLKEGSVELRSYQEAIVASALERNTLVVLPTGLGKTVIAAMIAAHRLYTLPESKVVVLAPTRPLVEQHFRRFSELLKLSGDELCVLTGSVSRTKRADLWRRARVIFATPQLLENELTRGLELRDVSLLVFDECHRAVGDYPYVRIAQEYLRRATSPQILGLTASPGSEEPHIKEVCENLCIENIELRSEKDEDVRVYVQRVGLRWEKVELPHDFLQVKRLLESLLRERLQKLKTAGLLDSSLKDVSKKELLELQEDVRRDSVGEKCKWNLVLACASSLKLLHALELLETQGVEALSAYLGRLEHQKSKAVEELKGDLRFKKVSLLVKDLRSRGIDHPKLERLLSILRARKEAAIVFTQFRDTVKKICETLKRNGIGAQEFVGQAKKFGTGMSQREQLETLERFKRGEVEVLVATSVAEEGLDVPEVKLVVFYEPIPSAIRSIQRRGRTGRKLPGEVVVLVAKGTRDEAYYWASIAKEKRMKQLVEQLRFGQDAGKRGYGQQSLVQYVGEGRKGVKVYVDIRELGSEVVSHLRDLVEVEVRQLEVGDFLLSERVCAERKTARDFLQSIVDKRLFAQATELRRNFELPLLILEGEAHDLYALRDIHPNAVRGALAALAVDFGIPILWTRDPKDTAELLYLIARREQLEGEKEVPLRGERKPIGLEERQRYVIESLPNVSAVLAKRLLEKFGSVQAVMNASKYELMDVDGIGEKIASEIVRVVRSRYKPS